MRELRALVILIGFFLFTVPLMPLQLALRYVNTDWARRFPHWYHRHVCRLLGIRIHQQGEIAEDRPVLLIANHISWLDISVLSAVGPVSFVAKSEVGTWPFISWLAKLQGSVFVERRQRMNTHTSASEIMNRLREGDHIVIFAEGTSSDGNRVLPFRTSLFAAAKPRGEEAKNHEDSIYVQTLAIAYTRQQGLPLGRRGRPSVAWYGDMEIAGHAWELLKRGPLDAHVCVGAPVNLREFDNRKALAAFAEKQIRSDVADILHPRKLPGSPGAVDSG
ncbi:MAG: 1-acyl-sn-glycerol-3-phosphate acyltransferase [Hyphomicrobiaceae bacterium]|nr:1-acyl-sn-glycerol-3-phosphate acyltransferase [Hyphomicrobiaceae bacterium]